MPPILLGENCYFMERLTASPPSTGVDALLALIWASFVR